MAVCVYSIVGREHPVRLGAARGLGTPGGRLRTVTHGSLCAVVSDAPDHLPADVRNLAVYREVQQRLLEDGTVLPLRFGFFEPDDAAVRAALERDSETYERSLRSLEGCAEYQLQVSQDGKTLLRQILEESATVRRLNDDIRTAADNPDLPLHLGEVVAAEARARHRALAAGVIEAFRPFTRERNTLKPTGDEFLSVAFLVPFDQEELFLATQLSLAHQVGDDVRFRLQGPLPPISFV